MLFAAAALIPIVALALSREAEEFIAITKELEPLQCEKRKLRREIALAEIEHRDASALRARFRQLDEDPKTAALEKRLGELEPRLRASRDREDLEAISRQQRDAFYHCE
ncbi:MAG TPA: hypothetical protein VE756_05775 [Burkholderiales bacterium]|nr:hypothetical protein [Burkholderiales bacterium]